jgi:hypothetical protein
VTGPRAIDLLRSKIDRDATCSILKIQAAFVARRIGSVDPAMLAVITGIIFGEARL